MSSPTKLRQMAKELGWPPELEKAADRLSELERENAALRRDVYQCSPTSENDYEGLKWCDAYEELERENAALRRALADALGTFQHEDEVIVTAERIEAWKAALINGGQLS